MFEVLDLVAVADSLSLFFIVVMDGAGTQTECNGREPLPFPKWEEPWAGAGT